MQIKREGPWAGKQFSSCQYTEKAQVPTPELSKKKKTTPQTTPGGVLLR